MTTVNVNTAIKLPAEIATDFLTASTIGTWVFILDDFAKTSKLDKILFLGLSASIAEAKSSELSRFTTIDVRSETELFELKFALATSSSDPKVVPLTKEQQLKAHLDAATRDLVENIDMKALRKSQHALEDSMRIKDSNLLIALKASLHPSIRSNFIDSTSASLYSSLKSNLISTSAFTQTENRNHYNGIKMEFQESVASLRTRILYASHECTISGDPVSDLARFRTLVNALPDSYSSITDYYNVIETGFDMRAAQTRIDEKYKKLLSESTAQPSNIMPLAYSANALRSPPFCSHHGYVGHLTRDCSVIKSNPSMAIEPTRRCRWENENGPFLGNSRDGPCVGITAKCG